MDSLANLKGGTAVITGAGSGIGEGLARHAASIGMRVMLADVAADRVERVAADIRAQGGTAVAAAVDVSEPSALDRLAALTHQTYGAVRLLVNNAGIETLGHVWDLSIERWERTLNVNVHGVIHGVRAFVPHMLQSGEQAYIANVASIGGLGMMPLQTPYILSKHAVLSFTECLFLEMQLQNAPIHVSAVLPGPVATRIFEDSNAPTAGSDVAHHRAVMGDMLREHGMSPLDAARIILDGIVAKRFWVSTHPDITAQMAKARAHHLATLGTPTITDEMRQTLQR